jgi:predicted RNase H-like nuclease (RuvC/YqgF family)
MYQTHKLEFIQMHKDFVFYNTQMERKACGCTEEQEKNYKYEVEKERKLIRDHEEELRKVQAIIDRLRVSIQEKEAERDRIIAEYQQALKEYATSAPVFRESQLIKLKKQLDHNRKNILDKEHDFNTID